MNRKDLDALNELYLSVYDGEQLNEAPGGNAGFWDSIVANTGRTAGDVRDVLYGDPSGSASRDARQRLSQRVTGQPVKEYPDQRAARISKAQVDAIAAADKAEKEKATEKATEKPTKPIPSNASSATASTADKIEGGMNVYNKQITNKDTKGATETGKNISSLKFGSPEERTAKTIGTRNPLMDKTFGYQTGNSPKDQQARADNIVKSGAVAALKPATPTPARNGFGVSAAQVAAKSSVSSAPAPALPGQNSINNKKSTNEMSSYEWPSAKTIRDIAGAYASIYEAKKKVDQDQDGDNDFADVRIARLIASGVPKAKAIAMVKDKSYNEEVELWVNELVEEGYDLSEYTWDEMAEIYEATAMAKRGYDETEIRNEIAKSTGGGKFADKATALADRQTYGNKSKKAARERLARTQRGDFRRTTSSNPGLHGYAYTSDDPAVKAKQAARGAQRGVLTPNEKKELNREAYAAYEFVASYLLENNFASTVNDANVIINNMSEGWFNQIMEAPYTGRPVGREAMLSNNISRARPTTQTTPTPTSTSQGPGTLEKVGSTLGAKVGGFIGQNRGTSTGIPGAGTIGRVIGSNKGSTIGGGLGKIADRVVSGASTPKPTPKPTSGGTSTRPGDGKPYADGPLWDGGGPTTPTKPTSKPPMKDEPLW